MKETLCEVDQAGKSSTEGFKMFEAGVKEKNKDWVARHPAPDQKEKKARHRNASARADRCSIEKRTTPARAWPESSSKKKRGLIRCAASRAKGESREIRSK